jgi:hypothetical protein
MEPERQSANIYCLRPKSKIRAMWSGPQPLTIVHDGFVAVTRVKP